MKRLLHFQVKVLTIAAVLLMIFSGVLSAQNLIDTIAIIDGGSSGSRLYVYEVDKTKKEVTCLYPEREEDQAASKGMALSKLRTDANSVEKFLDTMTLKYDNRNKPQKDLYILATAGMRMINSGTADSIYGFMSNADTVNNYKVKKAMTISGQFEGKYAWIAANYDKNSLPGQPVTNTRGILEIGGASMQIVFIPTRSVYHDTIHYTDTIIYSKSFLGGGLNEFNEKNPRVGGDKKYKDEVIDGLREIKPLCEDVPFYGIGWALNDLLKKTESDVAKRAYVLEICDILGQKKAVVSKDIFPINIDPISTSWTKGAAYDIIINGKNPQPFNYGSPN